MKTTPDSEQDLETIKLFEKASRSIYDGVSALRRAASLSDNAEKREALLERACELADVSKRAFGEGK